MKYTYKERVRLAKRLKVFLAIFFAATLFFTSKVILDKTFAEDNSYEFPVIEANTNPTWYEDFEYSLSTGTINKITLEKYIGSGYTDYSIPATAVIDNVTYNTYLGDDSDYTYGLFCDSDVKNLTVESGVGIIARPNNMFRNSPLETVDLSRLDTSNIIGDSYWFFLNSKIKAVNMGNFKFAARIIGFFEECNNLEYVDLSNITTSGITDMSRMFWNCNKLKSLDLSNFTTTNVTNMNFTFKNCRALKVLSLNNFNTAKVTNMSQMFYCCNNLIELDISSFDTSNVENMSSMFYGCEKLKNIDVSNFNTIKVENFSSMFQRCISLKKLDVSSFNTSSATNMHGVFKDCISLKTLDVSSFNTSNTTKMDEMFGAEYYSNDRMNLEAIYGLENFDTSNVIDIQKMFCNCIKLKVLNLSNFNTSKVTDMLQVFSNTESLEVLSLGENWNFLSNCNLSYNWKRDVNGAVYTAEDLIANYNGSTMSGIYRRTDIVKAAIVYDSGELVFQVGSESDSSLGNVLGTYTGFDSTTYSNASSVPWYSNRNTIKKVTFKDEIDPISTAYWFYGMTNLTTFNNISNLNTVFTTTTQSMFENCSKLISFNFNNIKTNNLTNMNSMFKGCTNLQSLNMSTFKAENLTNVTDIFANTNLKTLTLGDQAEFNVLPTLNGTWVRDYDDTMYTGNQIFNEFGGIYRLQGADVYAIVYDNGEMVFQIGNTPDPTKGNVLGSYTNFENKDYSYNLAVPWKPYVQSIAKIIFTTEVSPISTSYWFDNMRNLTEIENIEYFNTSNVINMRGMFKNCHSLATLDLNNFDTSNVTDMYQMLFCCESLTNLDLSSFDTSNVTSMSHMFYGCEYLTSLDLNVFDTEQVTDMSLMFSGCTNLITLDISSFNTINVQNIASMFSECKNLLVLDLSNFETTSIIGDISSLFYHCEKLTSLDLSGFDTHNISIMYGVFNGCSSLTSLDLSSFDTSNVSRMNAMFEDCSSLENIDLSSFNTSNLLEMDGMFEGCSSLTNLDLSNFDTSNVNGLNSVFTNCSSLMNLDLSSFDTSEMGDFYRTFDGCNSLKVLDLSSFDMSQLWTMENMFRNTNELSILKLGTDWKFSSNNGLTKSWQRDGDTNVYTAEELTNLYDGSTMAGTYRVVTVAYAEFDSSNGTLRIYRDDYGLYSNGQTIDTKTYYTGIETITGTTNPQWFSKRSDIISIVIEDDFKPKTAYSMFSTMSNLTTITGMEKLITVDIEHMEGMFYGCTKLQNLDLSSFNTSNVINMEAMFCNCSNLTSVDVSSFDTSNVTNMEAMFYNCSNLTSLDLSGFNTSKVIRMLNMFNNCTKLQNLDISGFNTSNVITMVQMFWNCSNLTSLDVSSFNTSKVTVMSAMFNGCSSLTTLNLNNFDTNKVTSMSAMFEGCSSLSSLNLDNWNLSSIANTSNLGGMFSGTATLNLSTKNWIIPVNFSDAFYRNCGGSSIKTIDVTGWDLSVTKNLTGLFGGGYSLQQIIGLDTWDTSNVENMLTMFQNCSSLTSVDVSSFDTSNVTNMEAMFYNCSNLTSLDLSDFDTSNVSSMGSMFWGTTNLNTLILGTSWNFLSDNGLTKSWIRDGDTTMYTAAQLTSLYDGSTMAGTYRAMVQLTITEEVRGSLADINKNFSFTINVTKDGVGINTTHAYTGSKTGNLVFNNGVATFTLKHNENISVYLPGGNYYIITQNSDGYTLTKSNDSGKLTVDRTATFKDTLEGTTPTSVFLDLIPYVLMIIFGISGLLWIKSFKRI